MFVGILLVEMKDKLVLTIIISFIYLSMGFLLLHFGQIDYGISFFVFLPFIIGYVSGTGSFKRACLWGHLIALIIFFGLLIVGRLDGMVYILMGLPIIVIGIALGSGVKYIAGKLFLKNQPDRKIIKSTVLPFIIFCITGIVEKELNKEYVAIDQVESEITLPYSPIEVYNHIKSVDTLNARKPLLMKLDLPVPQKCVLESERVGGLRVIYFEEGKIVTQITELEPGKLLKTDVIDYQLTGKGWLEFKEAVYTFETTTDNACKMVRTTTYTSHLKPQFYWRFLEKYAISQEHKYVFNNLEKDLKRSHNKVD